MDVACSWATIEPQDLFLEAAMPADDNKSRHSLTKPLSFGLGASLFLDFFSDA